MAIHKMILDDDFAEDFTLIAIHCSEDPVKMAFSLNKKLNLRLRRKKVDLEFSTQGLEVTFPLFEFEDQFQYTQYYLVANKCKSKVVQMPNSGGLFEDSVIERTVITHLLPEFKNVDFFLKIESDYDRFPVRKNIALINDIREVISSYSVDDEKIRMNNHLIFN